MSLLTIVQDAATLVGLSPPSAVASASDLTTKQLMLLATHTGQEVLRFHDWSCLQTPGELVGDGTTTAWTVPTDFDRFAYGQKIILDGGVGVIASGPLSPPELTAFRARNPITVAFIFYRRGTSLMVQPALAAGRKGILEYISENWITALDGTKKARFSLDNDSIVFPSEDLITLGIVWKWRRLKGFDYLQEYETWRQCCQLWAGRDRNLIPVSSGPAVTNLPEPITPDTIIATGG